MKPHFTWGNAQHLQQMFVDSRLAQDGACNVPSRVGGRGDYVAQPLTEELLTVDGCYRRETFSPVV